MRASAALFMLSQKESFSQLAEWSLTESPDRNLHLQFRTYVRIMDIENKQTFEHNPDHLCSGTDETLCRCRKERRGSPWHSDQMKIYPGLQLYLSEKNRERQP